MLSFCSFSKRCSQRLFLFLLCLLNDSTVYITVQFTAQCTNKDDKIKMLFTVCPVCAVCSVWLPDRYRHHMMLKDSWDQWLHVVLLVLQNSIGGQL